MHYIAIFFFSFFICSVQRIWRISSSKLSDISPAFNCGSAIGHFWSIYLRVNILRCKRSSSSKILWSETLATQHMQATRSNISGRPVPSTVVIGIIPLLKLLKTNSLPSKSLYTLLRVFFTFLICFTQGLLVLYSV